ncbi:MAG: hypothetical protein ACRD3B_08705 [Candidatus Sulfotelmatobacter sp.]
MMATWNGFESVDEFKDDVIMNGGEAAVSDRTSAKSAYAVDEIAAAA